MTITKRKLMLWRREALKIRQERSYEIPTAELHNIKNKANDQVLELTQELIDQQLLAEATKES